MADDTGKMIHVIGNAALDSVIRVDWFPRPGETIVALGASEDLGGKGANQALAAARLIPFSTRHAGFPLQWVSGAGP